MNEGQNNNVISNSHSLNNQEWTQNMNSVQSSISEQPIQQPINTLENANNNLNFIKKPKKINIWFIIGIIVVVLIVSFGIVVGSGLLSNEKKKAVSNNSVVSGSLYLVDKDDNKRIYLNTNGEIVEFDKYSSMSIFSYGSSMVEKDNKKFIINSSNEIIVSSDKYDSIDILTDNATSDKGLNYVAEKDGKYALLDSNGKELTEFIYSWISPALKCDKIYEISDYGKNGYISVVGEELVEPLYELDDLEFFADSKSNMLVLKVKDNYKIYNANDYTLKYEVTLPNAYVSVQHKYIYDINTKTIYLFDKDINYKTNLVVDVKDEIKIGWTNEYDSIFEPYTDYGYLVYTNKEEKTIVVAHDGKILEKGYFYYLIGKDFIFLYNYDSTNYDDSLKIYSGSTLTKTLNGHSVSEKRIINTDFGLINVPLECLLCNDSFKVFDKNGNLKFNGEKFKYNNSNDYTVYIGENKIVLPSGNVINIGENEFKSLIYDYNKEMYIEDYIVVKGTETDKLIDKSSNVIIELGDSGYYSMYSDVGIVLYRDSNTDKYYAFDYINKKKLLESDAEIQYLNGYKSFKVWKNGVKIYSLKGELIYSDKGD